MHPARIRLRHWILLAMVFALSCSHCALGETTVGGLISADTTWTAENGPYLVTESILVGGGATLSINPGVEVRFDPLKALVVGTGQLLAKRSRSPLRPMRSVPLPIPTVGHTSASGMRALTPLSTKWGITSADRLSSTP